MKRLLLPALAVLVVGAAPALGVYHHDLKRPPPPKARPPAPPPTPTFPAPGPAPAPAPAPAPMAPGQPGSPPSWANTRRDGAGWAPNAAKSSALRAKVAALGPSPANLI